MQGLLITLEGLDGSGKTTQISLLKAFLLKKGRKVFVTREPGGTQMGEAVRKILLSDAFSVGTEGEALLYAACRAQLSQEVLLPTLQEGTDVICDRYLDSSLAYQGFGRGLSVDWLRQINHPAALTPNITIYLDIDPEAALERASSAHALDRIEKEALDFHQRVRNGYLTLAKEEPDRFACLSATLPHNILHQEICDRLMLCYKKTGIAVTAS